METKEREPTACKSLEGQGLHVAFREEAHAGRLSQGKVSELLVRLGTKHSLSALEIRPSQDLDPEQSKTKISLSKALQVLVGTIPGPVMVL